MISVFTYLSNPTNICDHGTEYAFSLCYIRNDQVFDFTKFNMALWYGVLVYVDTVILAGWQLLWHKAGNTTTEGPHIGFAEKSVFSFFFFK